MHIAERCADIERVCFSFDVVCGGNFVSFSFVFMFAPELGEFGVRYLVCDLETKVSGIIDFDFVDAGEGVCGATVMDWILIDVSFGAGGDEPSEGVSMCGAMVQAEA